MVCLDWFVAASSDEAGRKSEGTTDVLLMIDAETGYGCHSGQVQGGREPT